MKQKAPFVNDKIDAYKYVAQFMMSIRKWKHFFSPFWELI